ncbi:MAG TPA: flagellar motor switch protein FliM [Opitutales bacterium]|mgnify:CR=1 FL=1|nr:flagellar motor switch protein FliM [Opitutales bacterium]
MADAPRENEDLNEILSQSDIDALMSEAMTTPQDVVYSYDGRRIEASEKIHIEAYDFRNPVFLTENELRQVRIRHEQFIHYLSARLSLFLRMDFGLKMSQLYTVPYKRFTESIPNPTHITLFRVEQLAGVGILDINPRLAMTIVDRLLGGKGHSVRDERYLTEIEIALVEDVIYLILEEWCRQWEDTRELNASIIGRENNGRFLQTSPHDAIMLVLTMEATLGDCSEAMQIALPYYTIEPVIRKMQENAKRFNSTSGEKQEARWMPVYNDINVPLRAEWKAFEATVRDVLSIRPGDTIILPANIMQDTVVCLADSERFRGEVGLDGEHVVVKIGEVIHREATLKEKATK